MRSFLPAILFSLERTSRSSLLVSWRFSDPLRSTSLRRAAGRSSSSILWVNRELLFPRRGAAAGQAQRPCNKLSSATMRLSWTSSHVVFAGIPSDVCAPTRQCSTSLSLGSAGTPHDDLWPTLPAQHLPLNEDPLLQYRKAVCVHSQNLLARSPEPPLQSTISACPLVLQSSSMGHDGPQRSAAHPAPEEWVSSERRTELQRTLQAIFRVSLNAVYLASLILPQRRPSPVL